MLSAISFAQVCGIYRLSIVKILSALSRIKEVALIHCSADSRTAPIISYSKITPLQKRLVAALNLDRFSAA